MPKDLVCGEEIIFEVDSLKCEDKMDEKTAGKELKMPDNINPDNVGEFVVRSEANNRSIPTQEEETGNLLGGLITNLEDNTSSAISAATINDNRSVDYSKHVTSTGLGQCKESLKNVSHKDQYATTYCESQDNKKVKLQNHTLSCGTIHALPSSEREPSDKCLCPNEENSNQPQDSSDDKPHCQFTLELYHLAKASNLKQKSNFTSTNQKSDLADTGTNNVICFKSNNALPKETVGEKVHDEDKCEHSSIIDRGQYEEDPFKECNHCNKEALSSYKQHANDQMEVDIETDDEETGRAFLSPSIYQSYEENPLSTHFQTREDTESLVVCPIIAEYNTCSGEYSVSSPVLGPSDSVKNLDIFLPNVSTCTSTFTKKKLNEEAASFLQSDISSPSSSKASLSVSIPSSDASQVIGPMIDDHEGALCTGDQNFKTSSACQTTLVPLLQSNQSYPLVSCVNQSGFKAALKRGMLICVCLSKRVFFSVFFSHKPYLLP